MDYSLDDYLDLDMINKINSISSKLDLIMDDLYFGKKVDISKLESDKREILLIKKEYDELVESVKEMLIKDRTILSRGAGRKFILSYLTSMLIYVSPIFITVAISVFSQGMKYFSCARELSNEDVINEYLSNFDDIKRRIDGYDEVIDIKINKILSLNL